MFSQNRSEMESKLSRIVLWIYSPPRKMQGSKRLLALQGEITSELTQHISYDLCYDGIWSRNRFFLCFGATGWSILHGVRLGQPRAGGHKLL